MQADGLAHLKPAITQILQLHQQEFITLVLGEEEHVQQGMQSLAPLADGGRLGQGLAGDFERIEQRDQRADQCRVQATDFIVGLNTITGLTHPHGITQQHAAQAETPTVLFEPGGQAQARPLRGVKAPTNASALDPAVQRGQIVFADAEAGADCRHVQQVEHFADREAAVRQFEQVLKRDQQRLATTLALVCQGERDVARVVALQLAEDGADMRRVSVDVRQHDDYIARAQSRVGAEAGQQLVVEDFHFTLRAVRDMEADRAVFCGVDWRPPFAALGERAQFQDVVLQFVE
ncbi:hypothetical protein D9M71_319140 [compost metagenome]